MIPGITAGAIIGAAPPADLTTRVALPLTYDEQDYNGLLTWVRSGSGPHVTPQGMMGNGFDARYKATALPAWLGVDQDLLIHASVTPRRNLTGKGAVDGGGRDIAVYVGPDDGGDYPKLSLDVYSDMVPEIPAVAINFGGAAQILCRQGWRYEHRFPVLQIGAYRARPQAMVFVDANTYLITAHYEDTLSRCFHLDVDTGAVLGYFDFPSPYNHVASASFREDGSLWFGDYASGYLVCVDLAASLTAGMAVITAEYNCSAIVGFGAVAWGRLGASNDEYLIAATYVTSGTAYVYLIPAAEVIDGAVFTEADRFKRFVGQHRMQGITLKNGEAFTTQNRLTADTGGNLGKIQRIDLSGQADSLADGGTLVAVETLYAPSGLPQDLDFHPTTGWCWTSTEGYTVVGDTDGWMGVWSGPLDGSDVENHFTLFYDDSARTLDVRINNRDFTTVIAYSANDIPAAITIGGPPSGTANGHTTAIVRNVVISDQDLSESGYAAAVTGVYEPNVLQEIVVPLTNPGAESGTTGWTNEVGSLATRSTNPDPHSGAAYFSGGANAATKARQRLTLTTATGLSTAEIDAGGLWARLSWWQASFGQTDDDIAAAGLRVMDGGGATQAESIGQKAELFPEKIWMQRSHALAIQTGSRSLDVLLDMTRLSGTNLDGYFDDLSLVVYRQ